MGLSYNFVRQALFFPFLTEKENYSILKARMGSIKNLSHIKGGIET
jgi:hypothetical protein